MGNTQLTFDMLQLFDFFIFFLQITEKKET